jgi:hypothetical protein
MLLVTKRSQHARLYTPRDSVPSTQTATKRLRAAIQECAEEYLSRFDGEAKPLKTKQEHSPESDPAGSLINAIFPVFLAFSSRFAFHLFHCERDIE